MDNAKARLANNLAKTLTVALVLFLFLVSPVGNSMAWSQDGASIDDMFMQIGATVPSFGGMYVNPDTNTMYVYMVPGQSGDLSDLEAAMNNVLGSDMPQEQNLVSLQGQYTFVQLKTWQAYLDPEVLVMTGVVSTGIDHSTNRLEIGVANSQVASAVSSEVLNMGVPVQAVNIVIEEQPEQESNRACVSVQSHCRPVVGGLQIHASLDPENTFSTLTFSATRNGVRGFVTCSHCANQAFANTGTKYDQNLLNSIRIGTEIANPGLVGGVLGGGFFTCPGAIVCRLSDSSFAEYKDLVLRKVGYIARPSVNQVAWNGTDYFHIVAYSRSIQGEYIAKVGRTTGRTEGQVGRTCRNVVLGDPNDPVDDPPRVMLCQNQASYRSAGGDSGSPVFLCSTTLLSCSRARIFDVHLLGIHEAGPTNGVGVRYYSDIVLTMDPNTELGPLTKFCARDANNPTCS